MDLPSVEMALDILFGSPSDHDSILSDPPSDIDDMDFAVEQGFGDMALNSPFPTGSPLTSLKRKSSSRVPVDDDSMTNSSGMLEYQSTPPKKPKLSPHVDSKFEEVPTETLNEIVSYLPDDRDLVSLTLTCKSFSKALAPADSAVWKERFLSRYDHPNVNGPTDYATAYQLRRLVLRHFVEFKNPADERLLIQLDVLRDMVIETYFQPQKHLRPPLTSRNLAAFASPLNSPWLRLFLSTPFFPKLNRRYGQPHPLFDTLQLVFSHLLLSPASQMSHTVNCARVNYDLAMVYNWNAPFSTLYRRLPDEEPHPESVQRPQYNKFPNLKSAKSPAKVSKDKYELNTHALLHIRNFWHRHLMDDGQGFGSNMMRENTYARMASDLMRCGITPQKWDRPLEEGSLQIATEWFGNYSCLHPWPKKRQDLEEMQSCAEDWSSVDPMKLDFAISTNNEEDGFWPPIFRAIPAFERTIPDLQSPSCVFVRGLAPFVQLPSSHDDGRTSSTSPPTSQATLTTPKLPKYHPYLSNRLRGVIHSISAQSQPSEATSNTKPPRKFNTKPSTFDREQLDHSVPGWKRIVMILYKPSKRYLIQVLEHAEEDFGGHFGPALTQQMTQTPNTNPTNGVALPPAATNNPTLAPSDMEAQLDAYLRQKLLANPLWRDGTRMTRDTIEEMEEKFRLSEFLDWNELDYAYAYEGVILPGGKIMMGRWWRVGLFGEGDGMELSGDVDAVVEDDGTASVPVAEDVAMVDADADSAAPGASAGETETETNASSTTPPAQGTGDAAAAAAAAANTAPASRFRKLERGPFVFWC